MCPQANSERTHMHGRNAVWGSMQCGARSGSPQLTDISKPGYKLTSLQEHLHSLSPFFFVLVHVLNYLWPGKEARPES